MKTGEPYEIEYRFRGADDQYHWFLGKAMPLCDETGKIIEWFGTATDISEHKRLEEQREQIFTRERAAGERVATILESITDAFFAVDREWRFSYVNREAERLLQRHRDGLLGRCLWDEFPEALGAKFEHEPLRDGRRGSGAFRGVLSATGNLGRRSRISVGQRSLGLFS